MNNAQKHVIIAGVPRAGKTTLCSLLSDSSRYQHLTMDAIVMALESAFPETKIKHTDCWDFLPTSKQLIKFIQEIITTDNYAKLPYRLALDLYHITPQEYAENINKEYCSIYFLGYPDISVQEKFKQIRIHDTIYDWTSQREDKIVLEHIEKYIEISQFLEEECRKYQLPFINVSNNREEILKKLANEIIQDNC